MFDRHAYLFLSLCAAALVALCAPGFASANPGSGLTQSPQWTVTAFSGPTNLSPAPGSKGLYRVQVQNTGGAPSNGSTITVTDVLPAGLQATSEPATGANFQTGTPMSCAGLTCTYSGEVALDDFLELTIPVEVEEGAPLSVTNLVTVSGGGAPEASRETPTAISATPAAFGFAPGSTASALSSTQAGAHPDLTTTLAYTNIGKGLLAGDPKDSGATLPPGFVGDLADSPRCPIGQFSLGGQGIAPPLACSLSTIVGTVTVTLGLAEYRDNITVPLVNLTTNPGEIARFGFDVLGFIIQGTVALQPGNYAVQTSFEKITDNLFQFSGISLTVWGNPADPSHDLMRGRVCEGADGPAHSCSYVNAKSGLSGQSEAELPNGQSVTTPQIPYLTSPTQCTSEPEQATLEASSWEKPSQNVTQATIIGPFTGCSLLEFAPAITASPDTTSADTPAGFTFGVKMGQEGLVNKEASAEADIQDTTVTLPEGIAINPGQANGLGACQFSQDGIGLEGPPSCPSDSKVGTVEIETPVLRNKLDGNVYVLQSNPPDLELLVAPEDPPDGIYVKFIGKVVLNETTGQLVTTFEKTPQLPFSSLKFSFSGGAQAALTTPTGCGIYTTTSTFTPWSTPFGAEASPSSLFGVESGTNGAPCPPSPLPFSPTLTAGSTTDQAGGYTHFSLLLQRADDQQRVTRLQFKTPEGLLGMIAKVPLCPEPQAGDGTCPEASQIGHTVVEAGPGPYPLDVPQPGEPPAPIYLTTGYEGAPYGLSIVVPLHVGPFVLKTQVVRAKIEVDPLTSQLTITTGELPLFIDGVPADLRDIDAVIDRPEFMFNPTSCAPMSFAGTATGTEGASAPISSPFQMGSCQALTFKPNFKVSTQGKTSRADGASLTAKIVYPTGNLGANQASSQSNIKMVKVELPKALPSRLSTLQKACTEATFSANPANCPAASRIGEATAITPVVPVPLSGPAFFVSNGGAKFPELIVVLQGYGVTIDLHGETFISKAGITSSTFKSVPDVPIGSFELILPEGPDSALAANGDLCKAKLTMPTEFVAQNGAELKQSTPIAVTGCTPSLGILSHSVKGKSTTVVVRVPAPGRLTASGTGLSRLAGAGKSVSKAGAVAVTLELSSDEQHMLAAHQGRELAAHIKLTFTTNKGKTLTGAVTVLLAAHVHDNGRDH